MMEVHPYNPLTAQMEDKGLNKGQTFKSKHARPNQHTQGHTRVACPKMPNFVHILGNFALDGNLGHHQSNHEEKLWIGQD